MNVKFAFPLEPSTNTGLAFPWALIVSFPEDALTLMVSFPAGKHAVVSTAQRYSVFARACRHGIIAVIDLNGVVAGPGVDAPRPVARLHDLVVAVPGYERSGAAVRVECEGAGAGDPQKIFRLCCAATVYRRVHRDDHRFRLCRQ